MAEQAAGAVASAVVNGITDRALTTVMRKLRSRPRSAVAHEKLQRLETLVLKLRCAVEVSEKHAVGCSTSLLAWRDKLREAAAEAGAVVLDFQRRAREDGDAAATSASTSSPGQQQQQPAAAGSAGALYFTRSALSGMAQRVRDATRRLFSTDEDMKKLDGALEKMERLSPDVTQFLMVLQLEVSVIRQRAAKRRAPPPPPADERSNKRKGESKGDLQFQPGAGDALRFPIMMRKVISPSRCSVQSSDSATLPWDLDSELGSRKAATSPETTQPVVDRESEARMLAKVLEPSLRLMEGFVTAADGRDMGGFEWLPEWTALLRETVERGTAVLQTLCPGSADKAGFGALDLEQDGELYSFARAVEQLARYKPCFTALVDLLLLGCNSPPQEQWELL